MPPNDSCSLPDLDHLLCNPICAQHNKKIKLHTKTQKRKKKSDRRVKHLIIIFQFKKYENRSIYVKNC